MLPFAVLTLTPTPTTDTSDYLLQDVCLISAQPASLRSPFTRDTTSYKKLTSHLLNHLAKEAQLHGPTYRRKHKNTFFHLRQTEPCYTKHFSLRRETVFDRGFPQLKGIQDSLGFWTPRSGFRIDGAGFQSLSVKLGFWIPIVSGIPDSFSCILNSKVQDWFRIPQSKFLRLSDS